MMLTIVCLCTLTIQAPDPRWTPIPTLPVPISNNAVAAIGSNGRRHLFSFLGIDSTKIWSGVTNRSFQWVVGDPDWSETTPVPGPGRLAATAQALGSRVFVFGGYTVAEDGAERSVPDVNIYDVATGRWSLGAPIPVPVDDAVSGVWRDSLIFLVSGWHDRDNVSNVQIYDPSLDRWMEATPIPGTPVFGHTGGIAGDAIVYVDGARRTAGRPRYRLTREAWRGDIDPRDPTNIAWRRIEDYPSAPLYRGASVGIDRWVLFAGGTSNPYNYNGVGYDGNPSQPSSRFFGYDIDANRWYEFAPLPEATMDHRSIAREGGYLFIVGGMIAGQRVTTRAVRAVWPR